LQEVHEAERIAQKLPANCFIFLIKLLKTRLQAGETFSLKTAMGTMALQRL
jgi:hypothetical protein